jgi:mannose-6-phosphate isomerase-like protein (cupin superfamily)
LTGIYKIVSELKEESMRITLVTALAASLFIGGSLSATYLRPLQTDDVVHVQAAAVDSMLKKIAGTYATETIAELKPYTVRLESRIPRPDPVVGTHVDEAECYYIIDGTGTLVTGATPNDAPTVGQRRRVAKGDFVFIPENTIHWWNAIEGSVTYIAMRVPRKH